MAGPGAGGTGEQLDPRADFAVRRAALMGGLSMRQARWARRAVAVAIVAAIAYYLRPLLHPFAMFFYVAPLVWLPPLLVFLVGLAAAIFSGRGSALARDGSTFRDPVGGGTWTFGDGEFRRLAQLGPPRAMRMLAISAALAFVTFIVFGSLNGQLVTRALYNDTTYRPIDRLPAQGAIRVVPQEVAVQIARSGFNSPTERLTEFHIVRSGAGLAWTALRTPDGAVRALTQRSQGMLSLDASRTERTVKQIDSEFRTAPGMYLTDNLRWRLLKRHFLVEIPELFAAEGARGEPLIVAPYITYRGWLIRRPKLGGVFVVHADGRIEDLSPAAARARPELARSGRLYPASLARRVQDAFAYNKGLWNKWFLHENQTQITDTEFNQQPYLLDFGPRGVKWVTVAEPYGNAFAASAVFLTDALTGAVELWRPTERSGLTGNRRALQTVRSMSIPGIDFADPGSNAPSARGDFRVVEPRPIFVRGRLMYMASIIPDEANSVSKTVFVDAGRNKVVAVFNNDSDPDAERKTAAFIATGDTDDAVDQAEPVPAEGATGEAGPTGPTATDDAATPRRARRLSERELRRRIDDLVRRQRELLRDSESLRDGLR